MLRLRAIDTHTEGEPTRVVYDGFADLVAAAGSTRVADQREVFRRDFDRYRSAIVNEPRGADHLVGAVLVPPSSPRAVSGVIFFNNVGMLNGCGHGTIGVAAALAHLGRVKPGRHVLETPVGEVAFTLGHDGSDGDDGDGGDDGDDGQEGRISIENVASRRSIKDVAVEVPGVGRVVGDVAWGGNWFYLVKDHGMALRLDRVDALIAYTSAVREALRANGIRGDASGGGDFGEIDHVELFGPPTRHDCDSRNFVLCPGKQYDRSPCGTGTSAKMACLLEDGALREGQPWRQESIVGSRFVGSVRRVGGAIVPTIAGRAFVTAETTLVIDERDPFAHGFAREP